MRARQVPPLAVTHPHLQWDKMYLEPGVLSIKVQHAQGLKDTKLLPLTKQDPQCQLQVGECIVLSRVAKGGGCNPFWNQDFAFNINNEPELVITIKTPNRVLKDSKIGTAKVPLIKVRLARRHVVNAPVLHKGRMDDRPRHIGYISLVLTFVPHVRQQEAQQQGSAAPPTQYLPQPDELMQPSEHGWEQPRQDSQQEWQAPHDPSQQAVLWGQSPSLHQQLSEQQSMGSQYPAMYGTASANGLPVHSDASRRNSIASSTSSFTSNVQATPPVIPSPYGGHMDQQRSSFDDMRTPPGSWMQQPQQQAGWDSSSVQNAVSMDGAASNSSKAYSGANAQSSACWLQASAAVSSSIVDASNSWDSLPAPPSSRANSRTGSHVLATSAQQYPVVQQQQHQHQQQQQQQYPVVLPQAPGLGAGWSPRSAAHVAGEELQHALDEGAQMRRDWGLQLKTVARQRKQAEEQLQQNEAGICSAVEAGTPEAILKMHQLAQQNDALQAEVEMLKVKEAAYEHVISELQKAEQLVAGLDPVVSEAAQLHGSITQRLTDGLQRLQAAGPSYLEASQAPVSVVDQLQDAAMPGQPLTPAVWRSVLRQTPVTSANGAAAANEATGMGSLWRQSDAQVVLSYGVGGVAHERMLMDGSDANANVPKLSKSATLRDRTQRLTQQQHIAQGAAVVQPVQQWPPGRFDEDDTDDTDLAGLYEEPFSLKVNSQPTSGSASPFAASFGPPSPMLGGEDGEGGGSSSLLAMLQALRASGRLPSDAAAAAVAAADAMALPEESYSVEALPVVELAAAATPSAAQVAAPGASPALQPTAAKGAATTPSVSAASLAVPAAAEAVPQEVVTPFAAAEAPTAELAASGSVQTGHAALAAVSSLPPAAPSTAAPSAADGTAATTSAPAAAVVAVASAVRGTATAPNAPSSSSPQPAAPSSIPAATPAETTGPAAPPMPPPPAAPKAPAPPPPPPGAKAPAPPAPPPPLPPGKAPVNLNGTAIGPAPPPPPPPKLGALKGFRCGEDGIERNKALLERYQELRAPNAGGKAVVAGGAPADPSKLMEEMMEQSAHLRRIKEDIAKRRSDIKAWAREVAAFKAADMEGVRFFVHTMNARLDGLYDECAELKEFEDVWPEARFDTLCQAAALHKELMDLKHACDTLQPKGSCQESLSTLYQQLDKVMWKVERYVRERDGIEKKYKEHSVPWDPKLVARVKAASLRLGRVYMECAMMEVQNMQLVTPRPTNLRQRQKKMLVDAVHFMFRVHQFVGGDDEPTRRTFAQLDAMLAEVMGSNAPATDAAPGTASAPAGEAATASGAAASSSAGNGVAANCKVSSTASSGQASSGVQSTPDQDGPHSHAGVTSVVATSAAGKGIGGAMGAIRAAATVDDDDTQPVRD